VAGHEGADRAGGAAEQREDPDRATSARRDGVAHHLHVGRDGLGRARLGRVEDPASRLHVEEVDHQLCAGDAVHGAVVHLRDDADVAVRQALDDVELPQRAAPVERRAGDLGGQLGELLVSPRARGPDAADVVVEVEVRVLHPDRVVEPEGHLHDPTPERRHQVQAGLDEVLDLGELIAPGHRRRVEDGRHGHVHVHARRLEVQEGGVEAGESFHGAVLGQTGEMGWAFLVVSLLGLLHALNAVAPRRSRALLGPSFFASWLTIELVWHHLVFGALWTAGFVAAGALDTAPGLVGLGLMAVAEAILLTIALATRRTIVTVRGALEDLEPGPDAPRFPRSHVVLPFLMKRRKGVSIERNVTFARVGGKTLRLDVTLPTAPPPGGGRRPALLQIHGGAWVIGDKREQGIPLLNHMATQGWVGFNVNYRLSPGVAFPDHLIDVKRGLAWIREHADDYDVDPDFICVTGGSAGGHLTALMGLTENDPTYQPGFEDADTSVAAAVPFYGIYDFTRDGQFGSDPKFFSRFLEPIVMKAFVDEEPERFRAASPLHHIHADAPAFFVVHGDRDTLAPVEDARAFVERLRATSKEPVAYAEMQGAQHAFEIFPSMRAARVVEGVERFLSTMWKRRYEPSTPKVEAELADALTE
jgi:acetyl esterase/lipase